MKDLKCFTASTYSVTTWLERGFTDWPTTYPQGKENKPYWDLIEGEFHNWKIDDIHARSNDPNMIMYRIYTRPQVLAVIMSLSA